MSRFTYLKFALAALFALAFTPTFAYDFEANGIYYDIASLDNLTCKVTDGDSKYTGDVVIPGTVAYDGKTFTVISIGSGAFYCCSDLKSITIPISVTDIGPYAFWGCSDLVSISIPNTVTKVGIMSFSRCSSLTDITLSNSLVGIESNTFSGCSSLTGIKIPNSVKKIGWGAFQGCI